MELLAVGVWGYRRFEKDEGNLDVAGSPVAVVGPNEVGKTSFLQALQHLNHRSEFDRNELTRGGNGKACVRARFALDDDDRAEIASFGGVGKPMILFIWKREGGGINSSLEPELERDLEPRRKVVTALAKVITSKWARGAVDDTLVEQLTKLHDDLVGDEQTLDDEVVDALRAASSELRDDESAPPAAKRLADPLEALAEHEAKPHPDASAREVLLERRPRFLWFESDRRELNSSYSTQNPAPPTLRNLLAMADLDWDALRAAVGESDDNTAAELVRDANHQFETVFAGRWAQANVQVHLHLNADVLHIYVTNRLRRLVPIAERSAGLRHFVALLAFVEQEAAGKDAVVLIDEAEQHLHYDAQADLVRIFTEQTVAKKIIYTTHSAGCLPHDLGTGVRVLEPTGPQGVEPSDWDRSRIRNWFWDDSVPGFSPLLMAMGASTFAFAATRRAVVTEGISDVLLLPTLFREATGDSSLDFQLALGIAHVNAHSAPELDLVASRVVYLVDGDETGLQKRDELHEQARIPLERILVLGGEANGLTLEDLLVKDAYVAAVNKELERRQRPLISESDVGDTRRKHAVNQWAVANLPRGRDDAPSERAVAHHLLDAVQEARLRGEQMTLLDPSRRKLVERLHSEIQTLLSQATYARTVDESA
jgi:hypothetical protein